MNTMFWRFCRGACLGAAGLVAIALAGCGEEPTPEPEQNDASVSAAASLPDRAAVGENAAPENPQAGMRSGAAGKTDPRAADADPPPGTRNRVLSDPDSYILGWIYYDWSGVDPGLDALAEKKVPRPGGMYDGQVVNEFNRADLLAVERARLEGLFAEGRGVGTIITNISSQLSDYDRGYGEFYINAFSPGSMVNFGPSYDRAAQDRHRGVDNLFARVKLVNALEAYVWKMSPEEAARVIALFESEGNRGRNVYARVRMKIRGAKPAALPDHTIEATIETFTLFTDNNTRLADFDLTQ